MCLIALALERHARYPLIVIANRDEFFARPTRTARWWQGGDLLAGRDEQAGGTWLGVTRAGRFAALTNYRQLVNGAPTNPDPLRSRGALVTDYLLGADAAAFESHLARDSAQYAGFSLLYGDIAGPDAGMRYFSNRGRGAATLADGVHGLSNALLDSPWPKVSYITAALGDALDHPKVHSDALMNILDNRRRADDSELPKTGVGIEAERLLSSPFIVSPNYGTRCSTVLLVDDAGHAQFHERSFDPDGNAIADERFAWQLDEPDIADPASAAATPA